MTLIELLRDVPINHRTQWEIHWKDECNPPGHYAVSPVGWLCHTAADKIEELHAQLAEIKLIIDSTHGDATDKRACYTKRRK
jgi:hypothetical protein